MNKRLLSALLSLCIGLTLIPTALAVKLTEIPWQLDDRWMGSAYVFRLTEDTELPPVCQSNVYPGAVHTMRTIDLGAHTLKMDTINVGDYSQLHIESSGGGKVEALNPAEGITFDVQQSMTLKDNVTFKDHVILRNSPPGTMNYISLNGATLLDGFTMENNVYVDGGGVSDVCPTVHGTINVKSGAFLQIFFPAETVHVEDQTVVEALASGTIQTLEIPTDAKDLHLEGVSKMNKIVLTGENAPTNTYSGIDVQTEGRGSLLFSARSRDGASSDVRKIVEYDNSITGTYSSYIVANNAQSLVITADPDAGYQLEHIKVVDRSGAVLQPVSHTGNVYTYAVSASGLSVEASFVEQSGGASVEPDNDDESSVTDSENVVYNPSDSETGGGLTSKPSVSTSGIGGRASASSDGVVTITPDEGYRIAQITVNGEKVDIPSDGKMIGLDGNDKVVVSFETINGSDDEDEPNTSSTSFADVSMDAWYANAVRYVYKNGMMNGTSATLFSPDETTTRGMIVTMLHRLENTPSMASSGFADVPESKWYADAVAWAAANGVVNGISDTSFAPDTAITREQLAAILYRYAQLKGYDTAASVSLSGYTDASQISSYATVAMQWANAEGLITGSTTTTLTPLGNATRAEVATILMRFCEKLA